MQCFIDLCYLTVQRSTEIRALLWKQYPADPFGCSWVDRKASLIHFVPSKTEDSSGKVVDWPITPEIDAVPKRAQALAPQLGQRYVIHDEHGQPKTDGAGGMHGKAQRRGRASTTCPTPSRTFAPRPWRTRRSAVTISTRSRQRPHMLRARPPKSISSRGKCPFRPCGWLFRRPSRYFAAARRARNPRRS